MALDPQLLEMLRCPASRQPLREADAALVERVNQAIAAGGVQDQIGRPVLLPLDGGLVREDGFDKIFNTNVKGTFLLSRAVAKVMMGRGGGRIVNVTTVGAERGGSMMGVYHASKAALKMLTMCMAVEWASFNVLVNAVGPGMTKTEFSKPIWSNPELERQIVSRIPKGRLAEPEEIVGAVLFLCSDAAAYITGQTIYVDGGMLAGA